MFRYDEMQNVRRNDKEKIELYSTCVKEYTGEMDLLRRRLRALDEEMKRYGGENNKLWDDLIGAKKVLPFIKSQ